MQVAIFATIALGRTHQKDPLQFFIMPTETPIQNRSSIFIFVIRYKNEAKKSCLAKLAPLKQCLGGLPHFTYDLFHT